MTMLAKMFPLVAAALLAQLLAVMSVAIYTNNPPPDFLFYGWPPTLLMLAISTFAVCADDRKP